MIKSKKRITAICLLTICLLLAFTGCSGPKSVKSVSDSKVQPAASSTISSAASSAVSSAVSSAASSAVSSAASSKVSQAPSSGSGTVSVAPVAKGSGKHVICIDPGHQALVDLSTEPIAPGSNVMKTKNPGGATGVATGVPEYKLNLVVAKKVQALLLSQGYTVVMTRQSNGGNISNIGRADVANGCNADIFLRIHADSTDSSSVTGISIQIPGGQYIKDSAMLASSRSVGQHILDGMLAATGAHSRGLVVRNDMTGFNWSKRPVVLVEMGFMSNPAEDRLMETDAYQTKLATGMVNGINKYFSGIG
jgi:N-acetylmuramoyl-L-alanine amidase